MRNTIFGREKYSEINANLNAQLKEKKCLIAQHRGAHDGNIPQNTALAYKASLLLGADMFELDVSKDTVSATVVALPTRADVEFPFEEHLIVELYSK